MPGLVHVLEEVPAEIAIRWQRGGSPAPCCRTLYSCLENLNDHANACIDLRTLPFLYCRPTVAEQQMGPLPSSS